MAGEECSHNSLALKYSNILDKLGYLPVSSKAARILCNAAKASIGMFGHSASKAIIEHMCSINGLSEEEILTNCDLLQTSLYKILRKGADVILHNIKAEILPHAILIDPTISVSEISNPQFTVGDIVKRICTAETLQFIRENPLGKHIAFLYENEYSKNRVLSAFFDGSATSKATTRNILLSKNRGSNHRYAVYNSILYQELLEESTRSDQVVKKLADWTDMLYSLDNLKQNNNNSNNNGGYKTIRVASENTTWWRRNGLADLHLSLEKSLGRCVQHNLSIICGYDISEEEGNGTISASISAHGYVILNEPFILYRAPGLEC